MKLVVHIGSHKAGSTSIQDYCFHHPEALRAAGIHYPTGFFTRFPRQHSELKDLVLANGMDTVRGFLRAAAEAAEAQGAGTVFLSGEDLSALGPGLAHRFQTAVAGLFSETEVVLVVRNKRDYLYSSYKHHLLHVGPTGEHDFVARQKFSPGRTAAAWAGLKGVNLTVLSFEAMKHDLLAQFFRHVFAIEVRDNIVSNGSLDYITLMVVNALVKDGGPQAMAAAMKVNARHALAFHLPIENVIADNLDRQYPDEDWVIPGHDLGPAVLERRVMPTAGADPVLVCRKMAELFAALEPVFAAQRLPGAA